MKSKPGIFMRRCVSLAVLLTLVWSVAGHACTRALYVGGDDLVITGRSMDWNDDMFSNLWVFPRGMARNSASGPGGIEWVSKYGSLIVSSYEGTAADGMNEEGLVANGLFLVESDYGGPDDRPTIAITAYVLYVLDNFATVAKAVEWFRPDPLRVIPPILPNGREALCHLAISDPSGDSAIFEYLNGKLVIHHGKQHKVLTNSPSYDQQLAIHAYWNGIDPLTFLPGSINAADRFARVSFLINAIPKGLDKRTISAVPAQTYANQAMAAVLGVMRAVSTPLGIVHPTKPNISSTLWRTAWNHRDKVLFFDSSTSPNAFWVPMNDLDFSEGAAVKKLTLAEGKVYAGNAAEKFEPADPFKIIPAK